MASSFTNKITKVKNAIINKINEHASKTGSASEKGHVQASTNVGYADVNGGAVGTDNGIYARADHQHALSSAYATSGHDHNGVYQPVGNYLTSQDITGKQDKSNIVTSWNTTLSNDKYPSEKLVKNSLDNKSNNGHEHTFITGESGLSLVRDDIDNNMLYGFDDRLIWDYGDSNVLYYDKDNSGIGTNNEVVTIGDLPYVPGPSLNTPSADTANGSYGSGTIYARSNHSHPKSSLYAEANHTHSQYANIEDIPSHLEDLTLSDDEGISSEDGHLLINNQTSGDYIGFADDLLTYDTANSVLNYNTYELATVNDIPTKTNQLTNNSGFLTSHQSLTPTRVYNCTSWNSTYIDTSSSNQLMLYKLGDSLYFLRYFIATKNLVYSTTEYNINSDSIPSNYRPSGDRTFYVGTNIAENARIIVKSTGKVTISATANNKTIYTAGTLTYWW